MRASHRFSCLPLSRRSNSITLSPARLFFINNFHTKSRAVRRTRSVRTYFSFCGKHNEYYDIIIATRACVVKSSPTTRVGSTGEVGLVVDQKERAGKNGILGPGRTDGRTDVGILQALRRTKQRSKKNTSGGEDSLLYYLFFYHPPADRNL